ncbi:putative FBD domain-containing protein [Helianthus annuus]|nr:putative FBD domain-containing protein [Helianthus annuus]
MDFLPRRLSKELPTALVHLKYLCIHDLSFTHIYGLPFLAFLIRSFPNLEKFKLVMYDQDCLQDYEMGSLTLEDYSDITLEHLNELEIVHFSDAENELDFVKLIMAKSPVLKKVWISRCYDFDKDKESEIIKILCFTPCAAPLVDIMW